MTKNDCITQWRIQDFPEGGAPIPKLGLFCKFFAENCMKMKEFGPRRGCTSVTPPLDPPMLLIKQRVRRHNR